MENVQRRNSPNLKQLMRYLIIVFIAAIFALEFGPGSRGCEVPWRKSADAAATINGKVISLQELNQRYIQQLRYQQRWFEAQHQNIPESLIRQFVQPKFVLDSMVGFELLTQAAKDRGVWPSDQELGEIIQKNPEFQVDGKFEHERYIQVLRDYHRQNYVAYQDELARDLAASKLRELVGGLALVSEEELKAKFLREGNKAQLTFVRFLTSMYSSKVSNPKADLLATFIKANQREIADDYEANRYLYHQPERAHAKQVLVRFPPNAPAENKAAAKEKIEQARSEIASGKDFGEVAKQYSEDLASKDRGGDLGFNERSAFPPEVAGVVFSLKAGETSQIIEANNGFYLVQLQALKPAENKELKDVQNDIALRLYKKLKAKEMAQAEAEKALSQAKAGKGLAVLFPPQKSDAKPVSSFETESKPKATETGEFNSSADSIPKLGAAPELLAEVLALEKPALLPKIYSVGDGWVVASVTAREKATEDQFAAAKESLRATALGAKQNDLRESYTKALEKAANVTRNDDAVAKLSAT